MAFMPENEGTLAGQVQDGIGSMSGLPPLSLTGGNAGPSGAYGGPTNSYVYATSGSGSLWFWVSILAVGYAVWRMRK